MSAEEILQQSENDAVGDNQFISHVSGKNIIKTNQKNSYKKFGAAGLLTAMIVVIAVLFSSGNIIPSSISERLIEETDVQYADAVASKELVFQQALKNGDIPKNTFDILKTKGVLVGYVSNGEFIETNQVSGELSIKLNNKIISADNFIDEVSNNTQLYGAFNEATYSRAAYYYDESAEKVFKNIGTTRNNYNGTQSFEEVMDKMMGEGSDVDINTVSLIEEQEKNQETGEIETHYYYAANGESAKIKNGVDKYIDAVNEKTRAESKAQATLESANSLKVADTMTKEKRSSLFYSLIMENISKMMAGDGNTSKINDAMNYLHERTETEMVDVNTGEIIKVKGSPLDSPSLYAILSGSDVDIKSIENYSSDRILKLSENIINSKSNKETINNTVSSASSSRGLIGRLVSRGNESSDLSILNLSKPIINSSLSDNSFKTINGVAAGEFLVEGAVNVGKELAKQSGASAGDESAVLAYTRMNNSILAMDAAVDRLNRSPLDITSKNTFLGSIVHNLAITLYSNQKYNGLFSGINKVFSATQKSIVGLLPGAYADNLSNYLTKFGACETYASIGAVGSAGCAEIATFDTSTLDNPFNNPEFVSFVENNTEMSSSGKRTIKNDSVLADYIIYNNERVTPLGVTDGGILDSLSSNSSSVSFISNVTNMIKLFSETSQEHKRIASGEAFVNSVNNQEWQKYKYAQRYVSLARATAALRQYADNSTAYNNMLYFEGNENPVMAFLENYYKLANQ